MLQSTVPSNPRMADNPGSIVEIRAGTSQRPLLELKPGQVVQPMSMGRVGMWPIEAPGVLDVHAYVYFDGNALFIQSADAANPVKGNGQAIGTTWQQYQVMLTIKGLPEGMRPRIREIANRMRIRHHSAVELTNRLEAGGYVRRERAEDDRREVLLTLTAKGERVLEELALHHHEELQSAAPDLVAALRRVMAGKKQPQGLKPDLQATLTRR